MMTRGCCNCALRKDRVALAYKGLWRVERAFRELKEVYHRAVIGSGVISRSVSWPYILKYTF